MFVYYTDVNGSQWVQAVVTDVNGNNVHISGSNSTLLYNNSGYVSTLEGTYYFPSTLAVTSGTINNINGIIDFYGYIGVLQSAGLQTIPVSTGTASIVAGNMYLDYPSSWSGGLTLSASSPANNDIDISMLAPTNSSSYAVFELTVAGQYISNNNVTQTTSGASTANQSHLFKRFTQGVWYNDAGVYSLEGGTVESSYNGDATNFPAGAINASKVLIVAGTGSLVLRLINRTTPAAFSSTTYSVSFKRTFY